MNKFEACRQKWHVLACTECGEVIAASWHPLPTVEHCLCHWCAVNFCFISDGMGYHDGLTHQDYLHVTIPRSLPMGEQEKRRLNVLSMKEKLWQAFGQRAGITYWQRENILNRDKESA